MIGHKYKPASQLEYALDIILNNRLHCSETHKLNDPMEGVTLPVGESATLEEALAHNVLIQKVRKSLRICSLSANMKNPVLWAHYASGFDGLVIEVELPDEDDSVVKVSYKDVLYACSATDESGIEEQLKAALSRKPLIWSYEEELRIIQKEQWYNLKKPARRVIVGHRMSQPTKDALKIICDQKEIPLDISNRQSLFDGTVSASPYTKD